MLLQIEEKVHAGRRLDAEEGAFLFRPELDLHWLGELADSVRRRKCGDTVCYNLNAHLNPTNVCVYRCKLCAYSCDPGDAKAFLMTDEEILARGREAAESGCTELHIVGGVHPEKSFAWYRQLLARLHESFPRLMLKAWTAVEIARFAQLAGRTVESVLRELIDVGLCCLPGGGAEIFAPEVRRQICPAKPDAEAWLEVHRTAHRLGLPTNATMLYGHLETAEHRIDHLLRLRRLQDETGGFQTFIPLAFHPENTGLSGLERPSGLDDLRMMAVSRLMLDNFAHIKAYWISLGVPTAQIALGYGADDLDGTVRHERIHHDAGSTAPEILTVDQLEALIREAGRTPVERDTLYRPVLRNGLDWTVDRSDRWLQ
ncbi:MAG: aminofutalosine synthase MqnE [Thermoguttaceae bacterium]